MRGTWSGIGRRFGLSLAVSSTSGSLSFAIIAAAASSLAIGLEPMAPRWLALQRQLELLGRLGRGAEPVRPVTGELVAELLNKDGLRLHLGDQA